MNDDFHKCKLFEAEVTVIVPILAVDENDAKLAARRALEEELANIDSYDYVRRVGRAKDKRLLLSTNWEKDEPVYFGPKAQELASQAGIYDVDIETADQIDLGNYPIPCPRCKGSGTDPEYKDKDLFSPKHSCLKCNGKKEIVVLHNLTQNQQD